MKLPGKRERLRASSDVDTLPTPAKPAAPAAGEAAPPAAEASADGPAPSPMASSPSPAPGPSEPMSEPTAIGVALVLLASALIAVPATLVVLQPPSRSESPAPTPSVSPEPSDPLALKPLIPLEPLDDRRERQRQGDPRIHLGGPIPVALDEDSSAVEDGYVAYHEALAQLPAPSTRARRGLSAVANDPGAPLPPEAQRYVRDAWPALQALLAAAHGPFDPGSAEPVAIDTRRAWDLALAALVLGRREAKGGAPAQGARWAVGLVRTGRRLACAGDVVARVGAVAQARLAENWLLDALERYTWTPAELTWLHETLQTECSTALEPVALADESAESQASVARAWQTQEDLLQQVAEAVAARLAQGGTR